MNGVWAVLLSALLCLPAAGQGRRKADARVSANLDAIARRTESRVPAVAPLRVVHEPVRPGRTRTAAAPRNQLRALAVTQPAVATSPVSYSGFPALLDNFTVIPPDTNGAVSAQYVMTTLNTQVSIQSRTGAIRANYPITLNAFWSALGSFSDTFDPRVQYDAAADRWIMASAANGDSPSSALLMGVSQTGDPGGNWNLFRINTGGQTWGDYPVLGFNGKWVVVSLNLFRVGGGNGYRGTTLYVFNKDELYQRGNDSFVTFTDNQGELIPARDFDNRPDTMYFVQAYTDRGLGTIRLSKLTGATGSESFRGGNGGQIVFGDPWDDAGADDADFAPQAGTTTKIDTGDDRVQNCVMRGGRVWCTHTVFVPYQAPTRSAVQWFEIDPAPGTIVQRGRIDDPSNTYFYAYPSIAVNKNNDVLLGFTRFGANEYPSAHFAFRTGQDPAGTFQPDIIFKRGEAPYISPGVNSGNNRWGDYSGTLVDPVDDLSFWTIQPYASTPPQGRRGLFGTWWAKVTAPSAGLNCNYTLSAATQMIASQASTGTVSVATGAACPWMAASNVPWITINSGSPATGGGTVRFSVTQNPNTNAQRVGNVTIAGQTFTVTQAAPPVNVDLTVTSMSAPTTTQAGQMATVTAVVVNQSSEVAAAFRVGFYLGAGPSVAAGDALLGSCAAAGLAPNASFTCNKSVSLPANIQPGQYVIGAIADDEIQLADTNRANNTRTSDFGTVTISNPLVRPAIPTNGVVSAASYAGGGVAPGEIITIFGNNLGPATVLFPGIGPSGLVDTIAGGTRVLFDGVAAPMVYALGGQVSAVVPFAVANRTSTQVQVEYLGTRSDPILMTVTRAVPGIFTLNKTGRGPGAILNQDFSLNGTASPAAPGSVIQIYATGGGAFKPGAVEGTLAQPPYAELAQPVTVRIGGLPAQVLYAGVAPGLIVGAIQINALVPADVTPGEAVPIDLTIGGAISPAGVTLSVR